MIKRVYLSDAQKEEAVRLAVEGKDPKVYLESLGVGDPAQMWGRIKEKCKEKRPEIYEKIPKFVGKPGPKAPEKPAVLKVDGPLKIETPEANKVEIVEKPEIKKPIGFGDYEVTAIRHPQFGEFYHDQKYECIDWRAPGGEEVSLKLEDWQKFAEAIPEILGVLGVQV